LPSSSLPARIDEYFNVTPPPGVTPQCQETYL
jgi:hypothetical protein